MKQLILRNYTSIAPFQRRNAKLVVWRKRRRCSEVSSDKPRDNSENFVFSSETTDLIFFKLSLIVHNVYKQGRLKYLVARHA